MGTFARVGINQIALCEKGTALTSPDAIIAVGLRTPASLEIKPMNEIKDYRQRSLRNMLSAQIQAESLQPILAMLKNINDTSFADGGMDVELLAVPQATGVDGGCFQFFGDNFMGVDFEWIMNSKKRSMMFDCNVALEYEEMVALIDAADSNAAADLSLTAYGNDFTKQKHPWIYLNESGFTKDEVIDYNFSLKSVGEKSIHNRTIYDYLMIHFDITLRAATIGNLVTLLGRDQNPALTVREDNNLAGTTFDKFVCSAGTVALTDEIMIGDDKRFVKLVYEGQVPIGNLAFSNSAPNGGNATDYTAGGTVTISA